MVLDVDLNDCIMQNMETIIRFSGFRLTVADFTEWDSPFGEKLGGMTNEQAQKWAYENPGLQQLATPHTGAREALTSLQQAGWQIRIVTATCMTDAQITDWLNEWKIPFDEIVKTSLKMDPHPLVDDNAETIKKRLAVGLPTIKFERPWNVEQNSCPSISHWDELVPILKKQLI